jgi:hypothetical protein
MNDACAENILKQYHIFRIERSAKTKRAFGITIPAHLLFQVVADLQAKLGPIQHPMLELAGNGVKDQRPWYFGFVKDSIWTSGVHDGNVSLRLYVNDDTIIEQFDLICEPAAPHYAVVDLI